MRYLMLLITLIVFAALVSLMFTSRFSILSPNNEGGRIQEVQPAVENMQNKVDKYNESFQNAQGDIEDALK